MVKILLIIPYNSVKDRFEHLVHMVNEKDIQIETTHIFGTADGLIRNCDADIIIARGMTCSALRQALPHKHLVEISMTSFDILDAIVQCKRQFHPKKLALCVHNPTLMGTHSLEELSGIPMEMYDVLNEEEVACAIETARKHGVEAFVGGLTLCQQCDSLGLSRIHIKTSEPAIERAITEAVGAARALNQERAKINMIQAVLNNAPDAIIAVNKEGKITAINNQAYLTCRLPVTEDVRGHRVDDVIKQTGWEEVIKTGVEAEKLQTYFDKLHFVRCLSIMVDQQCAGVLIMIQNADQISEAETKIRKELSAKGLIAKYSFGNIIGVSEAMKYNLEIAHKYSQVDSNVLLVGETGTGKELFAHSIHSESKRSNQPFVAVNCAALPENLLESELFGYAEGAFSGASKGGKIGLFELAHKGTIFLDEIGEIPITLQAKLLRVLQEKEIRRIGDNRVQPIDVRVISATNINIREQIASGKFRADLYYRLDLLDIKIAPLRDRKDDIPPMVDYFLNRFACDYGKSAPVLSRKAAEMLRAYSWPGNARELRNLCERLTVLNETGIIDEQDIINLGLQSDKLPVPAQPSTVSEVNEKELLRMLTQDRIKKEDLAHMLGMSRTTLWRRLKDNAK